MRVTRRQFVGTTGAAMAMMLAGCNSQQTQDQGTGGSSSSTNATSNLTFDSAAWSYDSSNDVYYQLNVSYCEKPADESYEKLAILVPGAYFTATDNGNGTYTCKVNESGKVGSFTAKTAPIVMPINTPGYSAQSPMSEYSAQTSYTGAGMVYVHAGCRGRDAGAPKGVTDLKAAVRFLRFVADKIAGNTDAIFTFGHSGGGAQSALMGTTGDSELYTPYLEAIGAVSGVSDAICGSMDWCPITGLDVADEAYEWMLGTTRSSLSDDEQKISDGLANAYATWVNAAGILDEKGAALELAESSEGIYQAGSYYEAVRAAIEESLNNFLSDTEFPYDASSSNGMGGGMGGGMPSGEAPSGEAPSGEAPSGDSSGGAPSGSAPSGGAPSGDSSGSAPTGEAPSGGAPSGDATSGNSSASSAAAAGAASATSAASSDMSNAEQVDNISRTETSGGLSLTGTYETASDYVAALNADTEWVTYDSTTNTATISSVAAFCTALKQASKSLGAFDQLDRGQGENTLFGEDGTAQHFDSLMAGVLEEVGSSYAADYTEDLAKKDALGTDVKTRVNMYTPLYYLLSTSEGYGKSELAKHWRIRTGINQGDTSLTTELNLALALKADSRVKSVDFATVWGQGHTQAERTGSADENFLTWVQECCK